MSLRDIGWLDKQISCELFNADVYIAAMGRSGSTWLSNIMTVPTTHWVLVEPYFRDGVFGKFTRQKALQFNVSDSEENWRCVPSDRTKDYVLNRYKKYLAPNLRKLEKWGCKEVLPEFHLPTIRTINPKNIVVLVRNIEDVALSLVEKWQKQGAPEHRGIEWMEHYCNGASKSLLALCSSNFPNTNNFIVKYEDISRSEIELRSLEDKLDWPFIGDQFQDFEYYQRDWEIERNKVARSNIKREIPDWAYSWAKKLADENFEYQSEFGYRW